MKKDYIEYNQKYYQEHREELLQKQKCYYSTHKEERLRYAGHHYQKNKNRIKKRNKEYAKRHVELRRKWNNNYRIRNKETINIKYRIQYGQLRNEILNLLGRKCGKCGFADERALQIDHINGLGRQERRRLSTIAYLKKIISSVNKGESFYQLLCANCNAIKRFEQEMG